MINSKLRVNIEQRVRCSINLCSKNQKLIFPMSVEMKAPMFISLGYICGVLLYGCRMNVRNNSD